MGPRNLIVSLEGNIGSGKSTLLAQVVGDFDILPEPVEKWTAPLPCLGQSSMLQEYYQDPSNSFAFQMYVLKTRLDQVLAVAPGRAILSERCMSSHDAIFATRARLRGDIGDVQWVTYRGWVDSTSRLSGERTPHGVVYLRTSPAVCALRQQGRDRGAEADLPDDLLEHLHTEHDAYVRGLSERGVPVMLVDGDGDPAGDPKVLRMISSFVHELQQKLQRKPGKF